MNMNGHTEGPPIQCPVNIARSKCSILPHVWQNLGAGGLQPCWSGWRQSLMRESCGCRSRQMAYALSGTVVSVFMTALQALSSSARGFQGTHTLFLSFPFCRFPFSCYANGIQEY